MACLAHSDETDDSHGDSQSHPGASAVPAALAAGESLQITGAHFLRAVALGYDIGPRVTMALGAVAFRNDTRRSTHSIAGTFGAAAAAGCAASLDAHADALAARLRVAGVVWDSRSGSGTPITSRKGSSLPACRLATESRRPCSCARASTAWTMCSRGRTTTSR